MSINLDDLSDQISASKQQALKSVISEVIEYSAKKNIPIDEVLTLMAHVIYQQSGKQSAAWSLCVGCLEKDSNARGKMQMGNHITLPPEWSPPKFSFLQRVKFIEQHLHREATEEFGTIIGFERQPDSIYSDLKPGWWCYIALDEDSPGWMRDSNEGRHEDELVLLDEQGVCKPCKH